MARSIAVILLLVFCFTAQAAVLDDLGAVFKKGGEITVNVVTLPFKFIGGTIFPKKAEAQEVEVVGWVRRDFTDRQEDDIGEGAVAVEDMYIFSQPNLNSEPVGVMRVGDPVRVLEKAENAHGKWYKAGVLVEILDK